MNDYWQAKKRLQEYIFGLKVDEAGMLATCSLFEPPLSSGLFCLQFVGLLFAYCLFEHSSTMCFVFPACSKTNFELLVGKWFCLSQFALWSFQSRAPQFKLWQSCLYLREGPLAAESYGVLDRLWGGLRQLLGRGQKEGSRAVRTLPGLIC